MSMQQAAVTGVILALTLSGCSTRGETTPSSANRQAAPRTGQYAPVSPDAGRGAAGVTDAGLDGAAGPLAQRIIYFDYDSDAVLPESQPVVAAHAEYLAVHAGQSAVLEGHADERGSAEYNIALGERRAKAVERVIRLQGAGQEQLSVVSFGEEKPAALDHDETAWQQNRRVEIVYSGH